MFTRMMEGLTAEGAGPERGNRRNLFEGDPHFLNPTGEKGGDPAAWSASQEVARTPSSMRVADANVRPVSFFRTAGQVSDCAGASALLDDLRKAQWLIGDRGHDADWFGDALQAKRIQPCIPGRKSRNEPVRYEQAVTGALAPSRSCSAAARTGAALLPATTAVQPLSSLL